jgi:hypothetical protein
VLEAWTLRPRALRLWRAPAAPRQAPGSAPRLAGPRRGSLGGAFGRGPRIVPYGWAPGDASQDAAASRGLRVLLPGGFEGPRRLPPSFGCGANSLPSSSPGVARPPRAGPGLEPAAPGPRGASGPPHPCSKSAASGDPRQPLARPAAARSRHLTTTVRFPPHPARLGTAEVPPPFIHWLRLLYGRGRRRRWRSPLDATTASLWCQATSWTLLGWVQSRESGTGKSSSGKGGEPGCKLPGPWMGW